MANFQEYTTKIFLNDEDAQAKLKSLRASIDRYKQDKQAALEAGGKDGDKAWKEADRNIRNAEAQIKKLSTTSQSVNHVLNNLSTSSVKDLKNTISAINRELTNGSVARGTREWAILNSQLKATRTELLSVQAEMAGVQKEGLFSKLVNGANRNMGVITQAIVAIAGLTMTIRKCTQAYSDMEEKMYNVTKYTGQTIDQVHDMNEEFKKIDTRTSRESLNDLASAAGRLGIQSHDEIMEFVDAADKINVALGEDLGDDAVATIGKLAMAFGEDDKMGLRGAMIATGSAVNELAQNSSASATYLVDFTSRLSGIGQQAGMTQAQIMGLGSVMDENMQRDEMASTAVSTIISKLAVDSDKFAKIAGINAAKFKKQVGEDMNGALLTLFDSLGKKGGLTKLAPMFQDMGLDGARAVGVLTVLANKVNDVRKNQQIANNAYQQGTSVINEFNVQNNTVQAGIDKNVKKFKDLTIQLGEKLLPVVKYTISTGSLMIKSLSVLVSFIGQFRTTIIAVTATLALLNAQKLYNVTVTKLQILWDNHLKSALTSLWTTIKANPYAAVTVLVVAAAAAIYDLVRKTDDLSLSQKTLKKIEDDATESIAGEKEKVEMLTKRVHDNNLSLADRQTAIEALQKIIPDYTAKISGEGKVYNENTIALKKYNEQLKQKALLEGAKQQLAELGKQKAELILKQKELEQQFKAAKNAQTNQQNIPLSSVTGAGIPSLPTDMNMAKYHIKLNQVKGDLVGVNNAINSVTDSFGNLIAKEEAKPAPSPVPDPKGGDYKSEEQLKKEAAAAKKKEAARKKQEAAALKAKRDADKAEQAEETVKLTNLTAQYSQGMIKYSDYLKQREDLQLASIEKRKKIWGIGTTEANKLADDELRIQQKYIEDSKKLTEQEIEQNRVAQEAKLKSMYYDESSSLYANEDALNEALFQNDIDALNKRIAAEAAGTENWLQLKAEKNQRELEHQTSQQEDYQKKLIDYRRNWTTKGAEVEEKVELNGLETLHNAKIVSEKEYQEMLLNIKRKYAQMSAQAEAEDKGPGSNETKFNNKVETIVNKAKSKAGDAGNPETDNVWDSILGNDLKNWKNINEQIIAMDKSGEIKHAESVAAKASVDNDYYTKLQNKAEVVYSSISNVINAYSSLSQANSDLETATIKANYDKQIEAAGNNTKKKEKLEKKRDAELKKAKTEQNNKAMKIEIAQAIAQNAMSAMTAYLSTMKAFPAPGNLILADIAAGVALAAGAVQIATIKKQHDAEAAGYYSGGFTSGRNYRQEAGIVHQGEFVANHQAVNNPQVLPALQLLDYAQRNNTISSLTAADISRSVGGATSVVAPVVNVNTPAQDNTEVLQTMSRLNETIVTLQSQLAKGIHAYATIDGPNGVKKQLDKYNQLINNA
jgi:TP901 family phage tail tape measure protein